MSPLVLPIIFCSILGLLFLLHLSAFVLTLVRYHSQPLPFRSPPLLLLTLFGSALSSIWLALFLVFSNNGLEERYDIICNQWDWVLWAADLCLVLPYALRAYRIFRIFTARSTPVTAGGTAAITHSGSLNGAPSSSSALLPQSSRAPHVVTSAHLFGLFLVAFAAFCSLKFALELVHVSTSHGFGCPHSSTEVWELVSLLSVVLLLLTIRRLRQVRAEIRDDYGQMREYAVVGVLWTSYWLATVGLGFVREGSLWHKWSGLQYALDLQLYRYIHTPILIARNVALLAASVLWPLWLSYHHTFTPLWSSPDSLLSLDSLLKDIICIQYFRHYLLGVQRVEWVLAWVEVELFKDLCDLPPSKRGDDEARAMLDSSLSTPYSSIPPSPSLHSLPSSASRLYTPRQAALIAAEAQRIHDKYLTPSAPMHVHVSPLSLHRIEAALASGGASGWLDAFDDVQGELYAKMNGEFARFLSSPLCEQCLAELEREELLRETLEKSGMI